MGGFLERIFGASQMKTDTITIDGRKFVSVVRHFVPTQEDYLMGQLRLAGAAGALRAHQDPDLKAEALLTQLRVSGRLFDVLAACLTECGKSWNIEEAARNAVRFALITNPLEKETMREATVNFVVRFFKLPLYAASRHRLEDVGLCAGRQL